MIFGKSIKTIIKSVFFFIISSPSFAFDETLHFEEKIKETAYSPSWIKLIHYKKRGEMFESLVDGQDFFLAADGKNNPLSELRATLSVLSDAKRKFGREKQHAQCAYPLRYRFLKKQLGLSIPSVPCKKLNEFMKKFDTRELYMVFSSAYPNNPASMFGHTLLRIRTSRKKASFMLDYGINYSAFVPPDAGGVVFAIKGIFGGYRGFFSLLPYYAKINEYNNAENRDIWEYRLNLTPHEVRNLLFHVWELENNGYFDYYFFDENCSYHLLALLEVVRPDLALTDHFLYITPADSIKKVMSIPRLVEHIGFRPSALRKFLKDYSNLQERQKKDMHKILRGESPAVSDSKVLDAAIVYLNYRKQMQDFDEREEKKLNRLLLTRSRLPTQKTPVMQYEATNRPDLGHDPHMLRFDVGKSVHGGFIQFGHQSAYHDLLANDQGYEPFSEILFPSVLFQWQNSTLFLEKMNFISITSLSPWSWFNQKLSWTVNFHLFRDRFSSRCRSQSCLTGRLYAGTGLSTHIISKKVLASIMVLINGESGKGFVKNHGIGPVISCLLLTNPLERYKSKVSYQLFYNMNNGGIKRKTLEWSHGFSINRNIEIRINFSDIKEKRRFHQIKIGLLHYFM